MDGEPAGKPAPESSLFSDEEDLFSSKPAEKPRAEEKKEDTSKPRKPVGAVSMFGGVDIFPGKKPSFSEKEKKTEEQPRVQKEEGETPVQ